MSDDTHRMVQEYFGKKPFPFNPAGTWLVVKMEGARDKTSSGMLYVPDTAKDAPQVGMVLAKGPGQWIVGATEAEGYWDQMVTKVGDRILFQKYAGSEIDWTDGNTYLFVKESDVVAYVKE
jgi:chaperonin GroES